VLYIDISRQRDVDLPPISDTEQREHDLLIQSTTNPRENIEHQELVHTLPSSNNIVIVPYLSEFHDHETIPIHTSTLH
jgi:hypothetical protein